MAVTDVFRFTSHQTTIHLPSVISGPSGTVYIQESNLFLTLVQTSKQTCVGAVQNIVHIRRTEATNYNFHLSPEPKQQATTQGSEQCLLKSRSIRTIRIFTDTIRHMPN